MTRSTSSFVFALCVSLAVHAALFVALPRYRVDVPQVAWADEPTEEMTVVLEPEAPPPPDEPKEEFELGDAKGTGYASHDALAERESIAPEADHDQAFLSLDPQGAGGSGSDPAVTRAVGRGSVRGRPGGSPPPLVTESMGDVRSKSLTPFGLNPEFKVPKRVPAKTTPEDAVVIQSGTSANDAGADEVARVVVAPPKQIAPTPPAPVQPNPTAVNPNPEPTPAPTPVTAEGGFTVDGALQPAADPARMSDSESDPFSRLGTAVFIDGDWRVRFGRKVKTRRPRLLLAGTDALLALNRATVTLKLDIDPTGKVVSAKVIKSSGSNDIDQPTRVAMYDWWFEPKKDAAGNPTPDQIEFRLQWR